MNLGKLINIVFTILIFLSVSLLLFTIIAPVAMLSKTNIPEAPIEEPTPINNLTETISTLSSQSSVPSSKMAQMFYTSRIQVNEPETPSIVETEKAKVVYDKNRLSYFGLLNTDGQQKFLIKDNLYQDVFPIGFGETVHGFLITENDITDSYLILTNGDNSFYIEY